MRKNSKNRYKIVFLYYAIAIILLINGITYSQYRMTASAKAKINTSKFSFKITDELSDVTFDLNKIVPGSSGVLQLEMDFSDIETATKYAISLDTSNSRIPENMKLYIDDSYNVEFSSYTGITELGEEKVTRNIYWKWKYTTIDETNDWMKQNIKIALNILAEQRVN